MSNINVKNIVLMEKVESEEAEKLYYEKRNKYQLIYTIPILCLFLFVILTIIQLNGENPNVALLTFFEIMIVLFILSIIITIGIYRNLIQPYKDLLKIAELNDKIRHEEKIRFKERKRLLSEEEKEYTPKEFKEAIDQTKK